MRLFARTGIYFSIREKRTKKKKKIPSFAEKRKMKENFKESDELESRRKKTEIFSHGIRIRKMKMKLREAHCGTKPCRFETSNHTISHELGSV